MKKTVKRLKIVTAGGRLCAVAKIMEAAGDVGVRLTPDDWLRSVIVHGSAMVQGNFRDIHKVAGSCNESSGGCVCVENLLWERLNMGDGQFGFMSKRRYGR